MLDLLNYSLIEKYFFIKDFQAGASIRSRGRLYPDMYIILQGQVNVELGDSLSAKLVSEGFPIGEIGFLRGLPATADVTALRPTKMLVIDALAFSKFESEQPKIASELLKRLASIAEERSSYNLTYVDPSSSINDKKTTIIICRDNHMLLAAQKLRYEVYCKELQRQSPFADHDTEIISDKLDSFGYTFLAIQGDEAIGTLRVNASSQGELSSLVHLYGMTRSPFYPQETAVVTKFIVKKTKRGTQTALKLILAAADFSCHNEWKEIYISCIVSLRPFYEKLGFTVSGDIFFSIDTGPNYPMKLSDRNAIDYFTNERGKK